MSDTLSSYSCSFSGYDEKKTALLYRSINKMLQEIEEIAADVNDNYNTLRTNMDRASQLITAIKIGGSPVEAADDSIEL